MTPKPIFVVTHPRSCSTAFERVFMTRDDLNCQHEPFGDAFYYGPERHSPRFEHDEKTRLDSGCNEATYKTILDNFEAAKAEGKVLFIKDMAYYILPLEGTTPSIVPSLSRIERGVGTTNGQSNGHVDSMANGTLTNGHASNAVDRAANPTILPTQILEGFHFAFLIRHPRYSVPSYFRCTVPPLDEKTGFYDFLPHEAGYRELRILFDYLRSVDQVGPNVCGHIGESHQANGGDTFNRPQNKKEICLVDADDLLDRPADVISAFCKSVGLEYHGSMLKWNSEKEKKQAKEAFEKWNGFHEDALDSEGLKPREHHKIPKSDAEEDAEWRKKFGEKNAKVIRETVNANVADYEYLKQFALKF